MSRATYHHGDLPQALIAATARLIEADGPSGFGLRKVAREAGVSPAAPSHHFGDSRGLLTAVAVEGFTRLVASFEAIDPAASPEERLREHGRRYVGVAIESPGHMAVMFRGDLIDKTNPEYLAVAPKSYESIRSAVADAMGETADSRRVEHATKTHWAVVHGIVNLYPLTGPTLTDDPDVAQLVDAAVDIIAKGIT